MSLWTRFQRPDAVRGAWIPLVLWLGCPGAVAAQAPGPAFDPGPDSSGAGLRAAVAVPAEGVTVPYSRLLFGGFIEHFDGQIYGGIFEPGSPLSDKRGFRRDVIAALRELRLAIVRWPGGCFASGYHWRDGVGRNRQAVPDPVWGVVDPNTFGTAEFVAWWICSRRPATAAGSGSPSTSGTCAVGITRGSRAKQSATRATPRWPH